MFVELKKKVGGIVYKRRIALPAARADAFLRGEVSVPGQIAREISWFQRMYGAQPRLLIAYDRTAFAGVTEPGLRVTFDTGIRWRTDHLSLTAGDGGAPLLGDDRILMELKTPDACPLWLSRALSQAGARATSFSKYGTCYREHLEAGAQNHFKEALHSA